MISKNHFYTVLTLAMLLLPANAMECRGSQKYNVTFHIRWTRNRFGLNVPSNAYVSPLTAATHIKRFSPFSMYGYADKAIEIFAESGNNTMLVSQLRANPMVTSVGALDQPTSNNGLATVVVIADGAKGATQVSAIAMLAPTPDWIVAFNNVRLCYYGNWLHKQIGPLFVYDAGTEDTIGVDQIPQQNIYRVMRGKYHFRSAGYYTVILS